MQCILLPLYEVFADLCLYEVVSRLLYGRFVDRYTKVVDTGILILVIK